jgi:hypothetical protein
MEGCKKLQNILEKKCPAEVWIYSAIVCGKVENISGLRWMILTWLQNMDLENSKQKKYNAQGQ